MTGEAIIDNSLNLSMKNKEIFTQVQKNDSSEKNIEENNKL